MNHDKKASRIAEESKDFSTLLFSGKLQTEAFGQFAINTKARKKIILVIPRASRAKLSVPVESDYDF